MMLMQRKKLAPMANKTEQKGKLTIDPMVESSWQSKEYSNLVEETILLVGQSTNMLGTTSRCFVPQTARVGQMKIEAPPRYSGKRHIGIRVSLNPNGVLHASNSLRPY